MLRALRIRPEAINLSFKRYWAKLVVFCLIWTFSPRYPPHNSPLQPSSTSAVCTASLFPLIEPSSSASSAAPVLPRGATASRDVGQRVEPVPSPLTPAYLSLDHSPSAVPAVSSDPPMPAKGSTTRDANTSKDWTATPALSEQPVVESAGLRGVKEGQGTKQGGIDGRNVPARAPRRGAALQSINASTCSTTPPPPPRPRLTPFTYTLLTLHLLFLLECLLINLETSPSLLHLPSTLPPPFPAGPPHPPSLAKRLSRARWRTHTLWAQCGGTLLCWAGAAIALVSVCVAWRGNGAEGWNAVFGPREWGAELRLAEGVVASRAGARGWAPLKNIVLLEVVGVFLSLAQSVTPLLIALGYLPSSIPVPSFLQPPPPSPSSPLPFPYDPASPPLLTIPLVDFTHRYLYISLSTLVTLAQLTQLVLARPPSHSLLRLSSFTWFFVVQARIGARVDAKDALGAHLARVRELACTFPAREREGDGEGAREWTCTVCFEGETRCVDTGRKEDEKGARRTIGYSTRCDLPCGHGFHAHCLARWFLLVAFCPTCHRDARSPSARSAASASAQTGTESAYDPTAPFAAFLNADERTAITAHLRGFADRMAAADAATDAFPGAAAAARREGRRRTVVLGPRGVTVERDDGEWEDVE
ncbi:hypothetical protein JCM10450v2_004193 [Rhodotorula kratochvilovae]